MSRAKKRSHKSSSITLISVLVFTLDGLGKYLALQGIFSNSNHPIFSLGFFANRGVAFSLNVPLPLALLVTGVALIGLLRFTMMNWSKQHPAVPYAIMTILGGSNNAIDRLMHNWTTDYLFFFQRLVINLSDVLVVIGVIGFLWYHQYNERPSPSSGI